MLGYKDNDKLENILMVIREKKRLMNLKYFLKVVI